ncbi:MAG: PepSY-associated TM helix domain-containing protein [Sphingomonas sp.]
MAAVTAPLPAPSLVRRGLAGHTALGLLAGALMYIVVLSGTLVVIGPRLARWEQPRAPEMTGIAPAAVQRGAAAAMTATAQPPATIGIELPTPALPRTVITAGGRSRYIETDGRLGPPVAHPWSDFVLALHEYLNLPATIGYLLVGGLGSMLAALAITGVVAHPRIFRDAFRLRARANRQLAQADWHNRLAVWTLPFGIAVALTGAFLGLAVLSATLIAKRHHQGDLAATYAPIFGQQGSPGGAPAPIGDVGHALQTMRERFPATEPTYVGIAAPGTTGQRIQIIAGVPHRLIYGESFQFDARGQYLGHVGLSDGAIGPQAAASTYKLHFGTFGGPLVELAYLLFGLALTVVSATGMSLWLQKRRRRGAAAPRLEAFWTGIVWGVPGLLVASSWLSRPTLGIAPAVTFWWSLGAMLVVVMAWPRLAPRTWWRRGLGVMLVLTGVVHALWSGTGSWTLIDAALTAVGLALVLIDRGRATASTPSRSPESSSPAPAA